MARNKTKVVLDERLLHKLKVARCGLIETGVIDCCKIYFQQRALNYVMEVIDDCLDGKEQFPNRPDPNWWHIHKEGE